MKVYIAGPMTYIPRFNFPAFDDMADRLRAAGHDPVSPAELDSPEDRARAYASPDGAPIHYESGMTHADFLARDIKIIADGGIEGVVVLPGWSTSTGALWETFSAHLKGIPVYFPYGSNPTWDGDGREVIDLSPVPPLTRNRRSRPSCSA